MSAASHEGISLSGAEGCAIDYVEDNGYAEVPYICCCGVVAARDKDGYVRSSGNCEELSSDEAMTIRTMDRNCPNALVCGNSLSFINPDYAASLAEQAPQTPAEY